MTYWRNASAYFFYFSALGIIAPFWNLYLSDTGFTARQIGVLGAIMMGTKIVSPYFFGRLTDTTGRPAKVVKWANFIAVACFALIFLIPSQQLTGELNSRYLLYALIIAGFSFFWNGVIAQYEAITLFALKNKVEQYGVVRSWGSTSFILVVVVVGWLVDYYSTSIVPLLLFLSLVGIYLSSLFLLEPEAHQESSHSHSFGSIIFSKPVLLFLLGCFLVKLAHGPYYTFYSIYLDGYGYDSLLIGLMWGGGVVAELILFYFISQWRRLHSMSTIMLLSIGISIVRWILIGLFPQQLWILILAQLMHAFSFASYHAVAIEWVRQAFGKRYLGQGQAMYSAVSFGAGSAVGAIVSGYFWTDQISASWQLLWFAAAAVSLLAVICFHLASNGQK